MTTAIMQPPSAMASLKDALSQDSVKTQFQNALADNAPLFIASLIDVFGSDTYLQKCNPNKVIMEALKAATLKLPINKNLGFAYIVPYKDVPQFQMGYKGYIQLAMRTGQYRYINADVVFDGELKNRDKLSGSIDLSGAKASDMIVGYFAHLETINGFRKTVYMTKDQMEEHGKKYSKSYNRQSSAWQTNFDAMALKTMIRLLLGKYGILSVDIVAALDADTADDNIESFDNGASLDIKPVIESTPEQTPPPDDNQTFYDCPDGKGNVPHEYCESECTKRSGCPAHDDPPASKLNIDI